MLSFFENLSGQDILHWIKENKRLKSKSELPASYLCSKCRELLTDPIQTDCGCRYCRLCFLEHFNAGNSSCLNKTECDNTSLVAVVTEDKAAKRDLLNLVIKCPFNDCSIYTEMKNIKTHILACEFFEDRCNFCEIFYREKDKKKHLEEICTKRLINCTWCDIKIQFDMLESDHFNIDSPSLCLKYKRECPQGCGLVNLFTHRDNCSKKLTKCPFPECDKMCAKGVMNEHLTQDNYKHLETFIEKTLSKNEEIIKLEEGVKEKMKEIESLQEVCKEFKKKGQDMERKFNLLQSPKTKFLTQKKVIFRKGTMIWKIENFNQLKLDALGGGNISKLSDPFYTSEFGYKLCIKVYPAGDGAGLKTYLSVYFVVMKGEYDDLLSWPFKYKVTLAILSANKNHSETFKPDPLSACYKKPTDECNIASGSPKFIKFEELNNFIINESVFLKMSVVPI